MRAETEASGELPLEYFLRIMRDPNESDERRDRMAMAAAPYLHPRLQATQTQGAVRIEVVDLQTQELTVRLSTQLAACERRSIEPRPCTHKLRLVPSAWSMSSLLPKADIPQRIEHVCLVPCADINPLA